MNYLIYLFTIILLAGCNPAKKQKKEANNNETEWVSLFDGETLNGWHLYNGDVPEKFWSVEDGVLKFNPPTEKEDKGRSYNIVTDDEYTNFELSLEWKISEGGNSGIFWGVVEDPDLSEPYYTGPEVQILDIDKAKYDPAREKEDEFYQPGALYDLSRPSEQVAKPAGMWNHVVIHINHEKNHGHVVLNSVKIHEFPVNGEQWEKMIAGSKFKDWSKFGIYKTGKIGLQDHGNPVAFKNIKIKNLR